MHSLDIDDIKKLLPHRFPFLLVDRVLSFEPGKSLRAIKNVTVNEAYFNGHFPDFPVMPGVLIVEALAQAGGLLINATHQLENRPFKTFFLTGVNNAKFKGMVRPGDQIHLEATMTQGRSNAWKMLGVAKVGEKIVCSAEIMSMSAD